MNQSWITCAALAVLSLCLNVQADVNLKDIEGKEWPGHNPDFSGPGNPDEIAEAALEFLTRNPNWSRPEYDDVHTPYAACVTGSEWAVSKKAPLTHQPTQYSINLLVAFTGEKDPDIAYVYHMVFYTREEAGVAKSLPLRYANSRQYAKYQIPLDMVKKSGGGFGLWRILLGLTLIVGGLIGARKLLGGKVPPLKKILPILGGLALPIGGVLAVLGIGGFLCNLVRLVPHASILPQLVAIALGLVLAKKALTPKPAETPAPEQPVENADDATDDQAGSAETAPPGSSPAARILAKLAFLDPMEASLGLAALALGVLHLLAGGFPLI